MKEWALSGTFIFRCLEYIFISDVSVAQEGIVKME
jgi:hypothetical protein